MHLSVFPCGASTVQFSLVARARSKRPLATPPAKVAAPSVVVVVAAPPLAPAVATARGGEGRRRVRAAPAPAIGVVVVAVVVAYLPPGAPAPELAAVGEASVPVNAQRALVQHRAVEVLEARLGVAAVVVLDKAEPACSHVDAVQANDDAPDVADPTKQLVDLLLRRVVRQVADVKRRRGGNDPFLLLQRELFAVGRRPAT